MADDLISRQVAIDAMENVDWYHINKDGRLIHGANSEKDEPLYKAEDIYNVLEQLPSAEPNLFNNNILRHPQCTSRTKLGNCDPVGGFCTSVPKEMCDAQEHEKYIDADLISRKAAIDVVEESRRLNHHQDGKTSCAHEYEHRHFLKILRDLPHAQPEIIRCKECAYASKDDYTHCPYVTWWNSKDDFCSKGKRRTDE